MRQFEVRTFLWILYVLASLIESMNEWLVGCVDRCERVSCIYRMRVVGIPIFAQILLFPLYLSLSLAPFVVDFDFIVADTNKRVCNIDLKWKEYRLSAATDRSLSLSLENKYFVCRQVKPTNSKKRRRLLLFLFAWNTFKQLNTSHSAIDKNTNVTQFDSVVSELQ